MDVTSLLNEAATAAEQAKHVEHCRMPIRGRMPWDAGGYSLPINDHSRTSFTPEEHTQHDDSNEATESVIPPAHKLSDSCSSLSSFTSSSTRQHSRFSSTSTVSSLYHPGNLNTDAPKFLDPSSSSRETTSISPLFHTSPSTLSPSPCTSLGRLAIVAENNSQDYSNFSSPRHSHSSLIMKETVEGTFSNREDSSVNRPRSSSPSDAVLIKRNFPSQQRLRSSASSQDDNSYQMHTTTSVSSGSRSRSSLAPMESRIHKRAYSAPNFRVATGMRTQPAAEKSMAIGPTAEMTPPPSQHTNDLYASQPTVSTAPAPPSPPEISREPLDQPIACMFTPDCNTGSQMRKAISHIFGRNKMCTRLIPQFVWVHYCRKHYQRSRYRNQTLYAKRQCDLIRIQIERLHRWSEENARRGQGATVQDWALSVRKREQKRLDEMNELKGASGHVKDEDYVSEEDNVTGNQAGGSLPATAVPNWLVELCGTGYSTEEIMRIYNRLHQEIYEDRITIFPDIEILPNIVVENEAPKSPRGYAKRRPVVSAHKRSQSLGTTTGNESYHSGRRMIQQVPWSPSSMYGDGGPSQKRKRNEDGPETEDAMPDVQRLRTTDRSAGTGGRRIQQLVHRPAFPQINEHQDDDDDEYVERHMGGYDAYEQRVDTHARFMPLPAPVPQRHTSRSTAARLDLTLSPDNSEYSQATRPRVGLHQRSQSDFGTMHVLGFSGSSRSPSNFSYINSLRYPVEVTGSDGLPRINAQYSSELYSHEYVFDGGCSINSNSNQGHSRHQSTPVGARRHQSRVQYPYQGHNARQYDNHPQGSYRTTESLPSRYH